MVKFETNGKNGKVIVTLPTNLEEITPEYLGAITDEIAVADNYSLIALCHKEKLSAFVMAGRNKKNEISTAVVPLFVKRGLNTSSVSSIDGVPSFHPLIEVCDKLIISPTAMAMGLHVNVPMNTLNMGKVVALLEGDGYAYQNATKVTDPVYFLEFKLIPNNEIIGCYKPNLRKDFENRFAFEVVKEGE